MKNTAIILFMSLSSFAFGQDMSQTETYKTSYVEMPDGTSRYVGKCSTHEDYFKFYYKRSKVVKQFFKPVDMDEKKIGEVLKRFDKKLVSDVLRAMDLYDVADKEESDIQIFKNYVDDMTVDTLSHVVSPELNLIRFSVGVGGGNGGYVIFNQVSTGHQLMSKTFDSELLYCDKKVWLQDK